jgi:non-heme chloroperoxidase
VLVTHGDGDQIASYANAGSLSEELLPNATLKTYHGFLHGMPTTLADMINTDLLAFVQS